LEHAVSIAQARALFDASPRPLGLVPTMGALHDGHLELVRRAHGGCASVGASIFVNPIQFGPAEDYATYPRDIEHDAKKLALAGADILFTPEPGAMYPPDFGTFVDVGSLGTTFEGAIRPGHFRGVATVIAKLLNIARPDVLYMGQKDAQQAVVVRKLAAELDFAVEIELVATVRESDGLAMSSRNAYLDSNQRAEAPTLYRALLAVRSALEEGRAKHDAIAAGRKALSDGARLDYLDLVDAQHFAPIDALRPPCCIIGAARFGTTRLIDNIWVT
jgi:pantoate--beta-alanine ligase